MDYLIALGIVTVALGGYYLSCRWWPYAPCFRCVGHAGKNRGSNSRRWGTCKHCKGSGKRTRLGARLWSTVKDGR